MTKLNIGNEDINEYDMKDMNVPYNHYGHDNLYINNNTNYTNIDDIYFNYLAPLPLFILSVCSVYGLCYLFNKIKSFNKNDDSLNESINIDSLNTLIVCDELPENNCSICLEEFKNEDILKKLTCDHIFHKDCLQPWINNNNNKTCPLCRRVVVV